MTRFETRGGTLVVRNALVFDGASPDLVEGDVRVRDGVVVDEAGFDGAGDATVIDARGGVVIPGLIDAHFHAYAASLSLLHNETRLLSYVALVARRRLGGALRRGFTTVRDVAGGDAGLHRGIEQGLMTSPRYYYSGAALSQTGGHGDPTSADDTLCFHHGPGLEVVDGVDELRKAVRSRLRSGAHAIKIMASGGVISPVDPIRNPQYSLEEIRAVSDEASRRGSYVAAHAYSPEAVRHALDGGVRSIEHGNLIDADTAAAMHEAGAFLVPTLVTYDAMSRRGRDFGLTEVGLAKNAEVLERGRQAIELARAAGVPVGFGTDLMGELEDEQLGGLRLQCEVVGALDALRSATSVNAELLGDDRLGRIRPGALGDLVVFEGNPLERPELLWGGARRVVLDGVEVTS
ncbi:amidohydrolase family protein [Microbacterium petrolearium]